MHIRRSCLLLSVSVLAVACGSGSDEEASPLGTATIASEPAAPLTESPTPDTTASVPVTTTVAADSSVSPDTTIADAAVDPAADTIVNAWSGATVDPTALPIGDGLVSTTSSAVGTVFSCVGANPDAPGASADGPWIHDDTGTWDSTAKIAVVGEVSWPNALYSETLDGTRRVIESNGLPVDHPTGEYPIAQDDPAYAYDRNPGVVREVDYGYTLPAVPAVADSPSCLNLSAVGILDNGVVLFNPLDARGEDAVVHEVTDLCDGHPSPDTYHYHSIPGCLIDGATGASTVVGWALDGFPIVVERDAAGNLPTNADLDECHGRTSPIEVDGEIVTTYHYSATLEFPYVMGCYRGTPIV